MRPSDRALYVMAFAASVVLLLAPALWNGFPLLYYDTGGYLARWYEGTLEANRAVPYGLLLNAGAAFAFWPVLLLQAALSVWVVSLTLRTHGLGQRPLILLGAVAVLAITTTFAFLTSLLLTDLFCGLGVLALYLLLMRGAELQRRERFGLIALIAFAAATHSATLLLLVMLLAVAALVSLVDHARIPRAGLGRGLLSLILGVGIVFAADAVVVKRLAWTPAGLSFPFGRMLQDGIVKRYLDDHCPDASLQLCAYRDQLPADGDTWFWGSPLFDSLGRFTGLGPEMERISIESTIKYPVLQLQSVLTATVKQLVAVRSGEGAVNSVWHTYNIVERFIPQLAPAMHAARQQQGELDFNIVNQVHVPAALLAMALLPMIALLGWRRRLPAGIGDLAAMCMVAILANAFVCGALSNPHDRYGARIVWIAVLACLTALAWQTSRLKLGTALADSPALRPSARPLAS